MAKVAVYNMEGKEVGSMDLNRVLSELHSGKAAELYSHRFQETTLSN